LAPVFSRLDHIIHSRAIKHIEHHILPDHKHGSDAKETNRNTVQTIHNRSTSVDEKKSVDMVMLGFTKAFSKVPHERLLHKLYYSVTGSLYHYES